jgi:RNA polymerase sigma-70 factor (ECF subfamily)
MRSVEVALSPERFRELVEVIRPELHRYCSRMTGSVADGEDIVQDVLARAHASMTDLKRIPQVRAWLFRIAHNRAIDHTRAYGHRMAEPLEAIEGRPEERDPDLAADERLVRQEAFRGAIDRFGELPPLPRSCVILKDVLDHSLEEIAELLEVSVPAVQAALHRGRGRLDRLQQEPRPAPVGPRPVSPALARYAELVGARDWDGVRALLADDVRLDVVSRLQRTGRGEVSSYFTNYAQLSGWRLAPGWLAGEEVIVVFGDGGAGVPTYFIQVRFAGDRVVAIRDFRHVPYIARDAAFELADPA